MSGRDITEVRDMSHRAQRWVDGYGAGRMLLDHLLEQPERTAKECGEYLCLECTR